MPRVEYRKSRRRSKGLTIGLILVLIFTTVVTYFGSPTAKADTGPDGTYGGANVVYGLYNSDDVDAKDVEIPIYIESPTPVTTVIGMRVDVYNAGGGTADFSLRCRAAVSPAIPATYTTVGPGWGGGTPYGFNITPNNAACTGHWVRDAGDTRYWKAIIKVHLSSGVGSSVKFKLTSAAPAIVGYSSGNTAKFAVANLNRCDNDFANNAPGADMTGCGAATNPGQPRSIWGKYFDYRLPFAPACSVGSGTRTITITDPDNPRADNDRASIQPEVFDMTIHDDTPGFTGNVGYSLAVTDAAAGTPNADYSAPARMSDNKSTATLTFNFTQGHQYTFILGHVYANNVLQFGLPFDSIYHRYACPGVSGFTNTPTLTADTATVFAGQATPVTFTGNIATSAQAGVNGTYDVAFDDPNGGVSTGYAGALGTYPQGPAQVGFRANRPFSIAGIITPPAGAPTGTQYCAYLRVNPHSNTDATTAVSLPACVTVVNVVTPQLIGADGDIHAGGGVCGTPQQGGSVIGNNEGYGEYVVTANGAVSNFGSNASALSRTATLGTYGSVCRPDLYQAYLDYVAAGGARTVLATPSVSLGTINGSTRPVVAYNGNLTISSCAGSITKNLTLVVVGSLTINCPITRSTAAFTEDNQPGLGIIATQNIVINPAATQVDAYLFANGGIDTCPIAIVGNAACQKTLTVNGFLMANRIHFHRLGNPVPAAAQRGQAVTGEIISLTPQLYINPPPLFSGGSDESLLRNLGELPSLY